VNGYVAPAFTHIAHLPHVVYEAWDGDRCLYVGMTYDIEGRMGAHRSNSPWASEPHEIRTTEYPDRDAATWAERERIHELQPANNRWKPTA
jgi:predicted GIY-YIG superfamily endonuclease